MNDIRNLPKEITKVLGNRRLFTETLFKRPESLGALLPYDEFLVDDKIFLMKDGSLGAVLKLGFHCLKTVFCRCFLINALFHPMTLYGMRFWANMKNQIRSLKPCKKSG